MFTITYLNLIKFWKWMWKEKEPKKNDVTLNILLHTTPSESYEES